MHPKRSAALEGKVNRLKGNGFICEALYPKWVSNPILVRMANGKLQTCVDYLELYMTCPKGSFPLPRIDHLVDSTVGLKLLSFMVAYSGYKQIPMHIPNQEHTSFITNVDCIAMW